ncbi:MAG: hypothetical protein INR62_04555 [Rhodospirillales bacterium]|nr:hypothetical protein [Acetobacter sp.]
MSDTGLHAGFHEQVRLHARQVDALIIQLRTQPDSGDAVSSKQVASLIHQLWRPAEAHGLAVQLLAFVARQRGLFAERQWSEIAESLRSNRVTLSTMDHLETLARFLEEQRAGAAAKMRGR